MLYAYCIGVPSSRRIEKRLKEDIAFRVLSANNTPDFKTIADFRKDHLQALAGLFLQVGKEMDQDTGMPADAQDSPSALVSPQCPTPDKLTHTGP